MVVGIVAQHGVAGLTVATITAGLMLLGLGLARLGGVIKFIPFPIVTGFTAGIALVIFTTQIRDLLGLPVATVPAEFFGKWVAYAGALPGASPPTLAVGPGTLAVVTFWPRVSRRLPSPFVALALATAAAALLNLPVDAGTAHRPQPRPSASGLPVMFPTAGS